jgi:MarR family 2-MHQ and catechol resistance regulon transcriptional repressor
MAPRSPRARAVTDLSGLIQSFARFHQVRRRDNVCRHGITVSQCYALETIVDAGTIGVIELSQALGLNKSTASRVVESLCGLGLTTWNSTPEDARTKRVTASKAGSALARRIHEDIEAEHARLLSRFPQRDLEVCRQLLTALVDAKRCTDPSAK